MTVKTSAPIDPSAHKTSFAQRRAARLAGEAEHGIPRLRRTTLRAGPDAENAFTMRYITDDGTSQT